MKKFNQLCNKIINEFTENLEILKKLKEMAFCPYMLNILQTIKNKYRKMPGPYNYKFLIDVNKDTSAIYGEYHFYYRIIDRCPHYTVSQIQSFIEHGLIKFLNDNYYNRCWNLTENDLNTAFTIFSDSHKDIKIKIHIFKTDNLKNSSFKKYVSSSNYIHVY